MNRQIFTVLAGLLLVLASGAVYLYARSSAAPSQHETNAHVHDAGEGATDAARTPPAQPVQEEPGHEGEHGHETAPPPTATSEADHDHAGESPDTHDHAGESADAHADHAGEGVLRLDAKQREEFGIRLAVASTGSVAKSIALPGEAKLNADRVAHVVPRVPGVVRTVEKNVGQCVAAGEILAWLESAEMGGAKIDYLTKWTETACCSMDLQRATEIHDNTLALLTLLETRPTIEELRELNGQALGENRGKLLAAYAEYVRTQAGYERDRALAEKKIASSKDLQIAESELKKSEADYWATRESLAFQVRRDLLETRQTRQIHEMELKGARRRLMLLGLTAEEIQRLEQSAQTRPAGDHAAACTDPNCKDCAGHAAAGAAADLEEKLAWYPLRAPFEGTIIEKHISLGEKLDDATDAFVIADLSTIWIDFNVYQKDLSSVAAGRSVAIADASGLARAEGSVAYVAPMVNTNTRTVLARVILPNGDGQWRPGVFVQVLIALDDAEAAVTIPKDAVQRLGAEAVVFVDDGEGLKAVPVTLGRESATHVEVIAGLTSGQKYVVEGAYDLKAQMLTGGLDPHAGHGH